MGACSTLIRVLLHVTYHCNKGYAVKRMLILLLVSSSLYGMKRKNSASDDQTTSTSQEVTAEVPSYSDSAKTDGVVTDETARNELTRQGANFAESQRRSILKKVKFDQSTKDASSDSDNDQEVLEPTTLEALYGNRLEQLDRDQQKYTANIKDLSQILATKAVQTASASDCSSNSDNDQKISEPATLRALYRARLKQLSDQQESITNRITGLTKILGVKPNDSSYCDIKYKMNDSVRHSLTLLLVSDQKCQLQLQRENFAIQEKLLLSLQEKK